MSESTAEGEDSQNQPKYLAKEGEGKAINETLAGISDYPQFWGEENMSDYSDPEQKAAEDREVEEFRRRLEEINQSAPVDSWHRKSFETVSFAKLQEMCHSALESLKRSEKVKSPKKSPN